MDDEKKNGSDERDSILVKIAILAVFILIMLIYLLIIMDRRDPEKISRLSIPGGTETEIKSETEKATKPAPAFSVKHEYSQAAYEKQTKSAPESSVKDEDSPAEKETKFTAASSVKDEDNPAETEAEKKTKFEDSKNIADIISEIVDVAAMYSREDTSLVTKKLGKLLDELANAITENKIQDTKKVMDDLGVMTDKIMECINIQRDKMADSEKSYLTRKTETLKESLKFYLMDDAYPIAEKLDNLIIFINDKAESGIIGKITQITDFAEIYSRKDVSPVTKKLGDLLDGLADAIKNREVRDTEKLMGLLEKMIDKIAEYIKIQGKKISDSERKELTEKAENLKAGLMKSYTMKDAYPVARKMDTVIALLAQKREEIKKMEQPETEPPKTELPKTEPPKTGPPKMEPPKTEPPKTEPPKPEPPKPEPAKMEPANTKEENPPVFAIPDNMLTGQDINALQETEKNGISVKTLCKNRQNTVHFLSSQILVRLVDIYPSDEPNSPGVAVIDVTHPRLGLRRFSEIEEGTTRPFEYGTSVFFLELLKIYPNCADVAVYERKSSS